MNDFLDHLSANDKDLHDLLISGRQRLTESVLYELARDRGIFYSPHDSREDLADRLSMLPHDFHDVSGILERREHGRRNERTTSVRLDADIPIEEIRAAVAAYEQEAGMTEKVKHHQRGASGLAMHVEYDEFDYSRTRLLQKRRQEAGIEFTVQDGKTVIRLPATEKAKRVVATIKDKIESQRKQVIAEETIALTGLTTPQARSAFFTKLISQMPGYRLKDVTNLKVASRQGEADDGDSDDPDLEDDLEAEASRKMFAVVHSMALNGQNLVQSREYQQLAERGFFITAVTWRAEQVGQNYDVIQFDAGFEDRQNGIGFKYAVQGAFRYQKAKGHHTKSPRPVEDVERTALFTLIESTARAVLADLLAADGAGEQSTMQKAA